MKTKLLLCIFAPSLLCFQVKSQIVFKGVGNIKAALKTTSQVPISEKEYVITFKGFKLVQYNQIINHSTLQIGDNIDTKGTLVSFSKDNTKAVIEPSPGKVAPAQIDFKITGGLDPIEDGKTAVLQFSDGKNDLGSLTLTYKPNDDGKKRKGNTSSTVTLKKLVGLVGIKIDDLTNPTTGDCSGSDGQNPLGADIAIGNRIVYLADRNLTFYYDDENKLYLIGNYGKGFLKGYLFNGTNLVYGAGAVGSSFTKERKIVVKNNEPLSFEVINVNPQAFDVEITDLADRSNAESNIMLELLESGMQNAVTTAQNAEKSALPYVPTAEDKIRVAMYLYTREMDELLLLLQSYCIYKQNDIIKYKLDARKKIDEYFVNNLGKPAGVRFSAFLAATFPKQTDDDTKLIEAFLKDYNSLPASYYKNITQVPLVDGSYDKIAFTFSVKGKTNTPYKSVVSQKTVNAWIKGGFKVDVSTGLYYSGLQDEKYSIRSDSTILSDRNGADSIVDRRSKLYKENNGKGEFGFASFLHFYPKIGPKFNISLNIGAGVTFSEKTRIRYLAGVGFLFGAENRLGLNVGYILGNVNKLSSQYANGINTKLSFAEAGKDPVYAPKFTAKPFISLTYNIPFIKKKGSGTQTVDAASGGGTAAKDDAKAADKKTD
ncbi:hypothetical protein SIO70_02020 [Chitinophaga sancti]|uniref:hypothetical protein n=1 Tax=Chitinophaga sancti TaxID=1004 RepID=UPI002A747429|nr:hypothetical protein [Chitinophaga sancti]WPQ63638.1 hypothetical protein SIO70_02020 [Chitinophaga sancti]